MRPSKSIIRLLDGSEDAADGAVFLHACRYTSEHGIAVPSHATTSSISREGRKRGVYWVYASGCMCEHGDANQPHSARGTKAWRCFKFVHDLMHARKYTGRTARTARWTRHKHRSITTTGDSKHKHRNRERCTEPQPGQGAYLESPSRDCTCRSLQCLCAIYATSISPTSEPWRCPRSADIVPRNTFSTLSPPFWRRTPVMAQSGWVRRTTSGRLPII